MRLAVGVLRLDMVDAKTRICSMCREHYRLFRFLICLMCSILSRKCADCVVENDVPPAIFKEAMTTAYISTTTTENPLIKR